MLLRVRRVTDISLRLIRGASPVAHHSLRARSGLQLLSRADDVGAAMG